MKVESFKIDHTTLLPGIYLRKKAETYLTYDVRMFKPLAQGEAAGISEEDVKFLSPKSAHALEHLLAFHLRDTLGLDDEMIYIGPMGCLTGFYILTQPGFGIDKLRKALKECFELILVADSIPAATATECGNYSFADLNGAKKLAGRLLQEWWNK